jgi:hypothetical protein
MATAAQKQAKDVAVVAERQAVSGERSRAQTKARGTLKDLSIRASGDMSRYAVNYSDDPNSTVSGRDHRAPTVTVAPRESTPVPTPGSSPTPGKVTKPVAPVTKPVAPAAKPIASVAPVTKPDLPRTPVQPGPPQRAQPGTTLVRTPSGGTRVVSGGKVPQTGALYESNPATSVTTASARAALAKIQAAKATPAATPAATPPISSVTSSTGVTRTVSTGQVAAPTGKPALYEPPEPPPVVKKTTPPVVKKPVVKKTTPPVVKKPVTGVNTNPSKL